MPRKYSFSIDNVEMIEENPNSNFAIVELDFFASGDNLNNMFVSEETLLKTANTIKNCPLVWKYDEILDDIYTHDKDEVPCGFVPETSEIKSKKLDDGRTMLSVIAYVWKRYTGELLSIFKRDGGKKPVSVEMIVYNMKRLPNGMRELLDFRYEGITVLGSYVTPAIPKANATVLAFSEIEKEYIEDYKKEFSSDGIKIDQSYLDELKDGETSEYITFPYKSIGEVNPAINGISPLVSLSQANEIAVKADAIGNDDEKNGWAIAISNFKKTHEEQDGKWVKKVKEMNMKEDEKNVNQEEQEELENSVQGEEILENSTDTSEIETEDNSTDNPEGEEEMEEKPEGEEGEEEGEEDEEEYGKGKKDEYDFSVILSLFSEEDEEFESIKAESEKTEDFDLDIIFQSLISKVSRMRNEISELKESVNSLTAFKSEIEQSQKTFEVEKTMRELSEKVVIPEESREQMIEEAKNYSLENIEAWRNYCKAMSFEFAVKERSKSDVTKVGMPYGNTAKSKKEDLWA